jgi:predicted AAA+ superfamily ATPase
MSVLSMVFHEIPDRVRATVRSVARHTATQATLRTIAADTAGQGATNHVTAASYLDALSRLMVIEDVPAWSPHLRSSHTLRKAPTRHFCDPSLAAAALGAKPEQLLTDLNTLGLLFESLVIRDLRVYSQANDSDVFHYRDQSGLEVDAIVASWAGPWAGFEIKLGSSAKIVDEAAANLLKFAKRVDVSKRGEPVALGVIVASGYGYVREDGVHVIPIGALGP